MLLEARQGEKDTISSPLTWAYSAGCKKQDRKAETKVSWTSRSSGKPLEPVTCSKLIFRYYKEENQKILKQKDKALRHHSSHLGIPRDCGYLMAC